MKLRKKNMNATMTMARTIKKVDESTGRPHIHTHTTVFTANFQDFLTELVAS